MVGLHDDLARPFSHTKAQRTSRLGLLGELRARYDESRVRAARAAYASVSGHRTPTPGLEGMVEEMRWGLSNLSPEARREADDRVLSAVFFGPTALRAVRALFARLPGSTARLFASASPVALRWLVGPVERRGPTVDVLPACAFRRLGGEALCQEVCRRPTERFCAEQAMPVRLTPHPASLGCTWVWGSTGSREGDDA